MRVLIVNSMFANALYRKCADALGAMRGVDLTMLTVDAWKMNGRPMPFEELRVGSPYRTVIGKAGWKGFENRGFYRSGLSEAFRQSKPEVLFLMEEPFSVFAAQILFTKTRIAPQIPVVFFTWNNLSLETFDYRPSVFYRTVSKWTLPRMHYGLAANSDGVQVLRDAGFVNPVKTVGYGVDTSAYSLPRPERVREIRRELNIADNETVIAYVGRLLHMKGVDLLIDAFARLRNSLPDRKMKLLLLGGGEEEAQIIAQAKSAGIFPDLRHVLTVPHAEVPDYMHALDILVLPSRRVGMWAEQFGRVLVEVMAAGKIVVGSSSGAIPEVIGDAGYVFEENNSEDLRRKLETVLTLPESEQLDLQDRARKRAANEYSWQRFAGDALQAMEYCCQRYPAR